MSVRALGTRFNVMAYHDELAQSVVLVEGLVEVQSNDESKKKILQPYADFGEQLYGYYCGEYV